MWISDLSRGVPGTMLKLFVAGEMIAWSASTLVSLALYAWVLRSPWLLGLALIAHRRRRAELDRTGPVDPATAARMVRPYSWLLDRVGDDGIKLTDAGHLPPAEVAAVIDELNLDAEGITRVSRENQVRPALQLRESAQATGLVRRDRGRLVRTAVGAALQRDPTALWWQLAGQLPLRSAAVSEVQPGLILLACVAAQYTGTLDDTIAAMLTAIGWINGDGSPLTKAEAAATTSGTHAVLLRLGVLPAGPDGVAFARAALSTWPGTA